MKLVVLLLIGFVLTTNNLTFPQDSLSQRAIEYKLRGEANREWLDRNNIQLNQLPKANPDQIRYLCDSTIVLKETKGDTINIWRNRIIVFPDTAQVIEHMKNPLFGERFFIEGVNEQGRIAFVRLQPETFLVRKDSLFLLDDFYTISGDSMSKLYTLPREESSKAYFDIIVKNRYWDFKLIFHPDLFSNGIYQNNKKRDNIRLASIWEVDQVKYYELHFMSRYEPYGLQRKLLFDENFRFLEYEGCYDDIIKNLTDETLIFDNR